MTNASAADTLGINSTVQTRQLNQANGLTHCSVPIMVTLACEGISGTTDQAS